MNEANQSSALEMPFEFTGTTRQYFGIWIVNILLTIVTLGIYSAWAKVRTKRYFYGNTLLDGSPFDYLADPLAILKGWAIAVAVLIAYNILTEVFPVSALVLVPLMFVVVPFVIVRAMRFRARNSAWRNIRFGFKKAYGEAARVFILFPILMVVTLGLFLPYYYYAMNRFMVHNSGYGTATFQFHATARDFYKVFMKPMLAMLVFIVIIVALIAIPAYKEFQEKARAAAETADEAAVNEADMNIAVDPSLTMVTEDATTVMQEQAMPDESVPVDPDLTYEEQQLVMMEQAMQELANAEANLADTNMDAGQSTDLMSEDIPSGNLAEGEVQVGVIEPLGSSDELPLESELQMDDADAGEDESLADIGAMAAAMSVLIMLFMFLFYLAFIAYIQSRTWNLVYNNTELAGHRFRSSVRARDIIWLYASNLIVVSFTFGLMIPWAKIRLARYRASKLVFLPAGNLDSFMQAQQDKISALGEEMGDVFDLDIGI